MKKSILWSFLISQIIFFSLFPVWMQLTSYLHPIVMGVVWLLVFIIVLFIICFLNGVKIPIRKRSLHVFMLIYSIGLLVLLFFRPNGASYGAVNLMPFETIQLYLSGNADFLIAFYNLGANIGLFIPFGVYYGFIKNASSIKQLLMITICSISLIEVLQLLTKRGSLDIDDLLLNTIGVCLGYILLPFFCKVLMMKNSREY